MPPKNDIDFFKIFSQENILVKSPYYEKRKKREYPPFSQPPNPTQEITQKEPSQYHLIELLYFSSSIKIPHLKNPLERPKNILIV
jgi:hypothetical protein